MARLMKIVMIQAALFDHDVIYTDGNIEIIGSTSTAKSTLIRVFYMPLLGGSKSRLGIGAQQREFVDYYYSDAKGNPLTNAFIVYEFINDSGNPVSIVTHKDKGSFRAELILGPYDRKWFFADGENVVQNWEEAKANIGTAYQKTIIGMPLFNSLMLGAKGCYNPLFSWLHLGDDALPFQALMSGILKRGDVLSESVADAFVAAAFHMKDNPQDERGINLNPYMKTLRRFEARENDIELINDYVNGVKTTFSSAIDEVFDFMHDIDSMQKLIDELPGEYKSAMERESNLLETKRKELDSVKKQKDELQEQHEILVQIDRQNTKAAGERIGQLQQQQKFIEETEERYKSLPDGVTFDRLAEWSKNKSSIEAERRSIESEIQFLSTETGDIEDARKKAKEQIDEAFKNEIEDIKKRYGLVYNKIQARYESETKALDKKKEDLITGLKDIFPQVKASELDSIIDIIRTESSHEATAKIIREALEKKGADRKWIDEKKANDLNGHDAEYFHKQANDNVEKGKSLYHPIPAILNTAASALSKNLTITRTTAKRFSDIKNYIQERERRVFAETEEKRKMKIAANDEKFDKLKEQRLGPKKIALLKKAEDRKLQLDKIWKLIIHEYPSILRDVQVMNQKESVQKELEKAITHQSQLSDTIAEENKKYNTTIEQLSGKIGDLGREIKDLETFTGKTKKLDILNSGFHKRVMEAMAPARPKLARMSTDQILSEYVNKTTELNGKRSSFCDSVKHLYDETYSKHLDPDLDTFDLHLADVIYEAGGLALYDNYRAVGDALYARFKGEGTSLAAHYVQEWSEQMAESLKEINRDVGVVERFMTNVYQLRNKTQGYINSNNYTDCFSDVEFIVSKSTSPLLMAMEQITEFCKTDGYAIGANNLFSTENSSVDKTARELLRSFSEELTKFMSTNDGSGMLRYNEMFDIEFKFKENGIQQRLKNVKDFGSVGTIALFKAYVNMALLAPILQKKKTDGTFLFCVMDEVNNLPQKHIDTFLEYANNLGFRIIVAGQNHLFEPLDFCYRTEKTPDENGVFYKSITLYATRKIESIDPADLPEGYTP